MANRPPFQVTPTILRLLAEVSTLVGRYEGLSSPVPQPQLRKENQVRTIHGSLAIEGNTLSLDQVTAVLEGRRVIGPAREITEVQNALRAYALAPSLAATSQKDLLRAHHVMMDGLTEDAGRWRRGNVGIIKGTKVAHVAPKAALVPKLMSDLFRFLKTDRDTPAVIKACVFHYELEFIHPFSDGNGRMGRLWQHVLLLGVSPVFAFVPVESAIKERQQHYYAALRDSDKEGDSTPFVEFSLQALVDSLGSVIGTLGPTRDQAEARLQKALARFGEDAFARKDYRGLFPGMSTATASRDLALGVEQGLLRKTGDKARAKYVRR